METQTLCCCIINHPKLWFKTTETHDSAIWAKLDTDSSSVLHVFWAGIQEVFFIFN